MPRSTIIPWNVIFLVLVLLFSPSTSQEYDDADVELPTKEEQNCNGIFINYVFVSRKKEFPHVKNATAQAWAFKSTAKVLNTGAKELKAWKLFVGFQHDEILVSADGAVTVGGDDLPASVGNGTYFVGYPQADLKTAIETAFDMNQIQAKIHLTGTQFGIKPPGIPLPKTIRLENDGFKCPAPRNKDNSTMIVCCVKDPKFKTNDTKKTKFFPRQKGDLSFTYDVLRAYDGNYVAQVTIQNNHPLGRLDRWNLTWEWMRGEFINTMRGAHTHLIDTSDCLYGAAGEYYKGFDFSTAMNCQKNPIISDLPPNRAKDERIGNIPYCCRNGSLLPTNMDAGKSRAIFQLEVYKIPPDINRTALYPPQKWKINGILNPEYKCGAPGRVDPSEFPEPSGLDVTSLAVATWQIVCNISRMKTRTSRCCVSFSSYYNDTVIPCNTCACGCDNDKACDATASPLLLPYEALLVPFNNRTQKALAWAKIKDFRVPRRLPCPDNCGLSINWHVHTDHKEGWTSRITLFNWEERPFEDWFAAIQMRRGFQGFDNVYSFNGTKMPFLNNTIFLQGLPGLNYLISLKNGSHPSRDPKVPGKQQSVLLFKKKASSGIKISHRDEFPKKVIFNGEECSLPTKIPMSSSATLYTSFRLVLVILFLASMFLIPR